MDSYFDHVCTWECAMINLNNRQDKPLIFETGWNEKNIILVKKKVENESSSCDSL